MLAIAPTDLNWFTRLSSHRVLDEVNFWTPTPWGVKSLRPSDRFYFLLKSPIRKIAGYADFERYEDMPSSAAWMKYGPGNGAVDLADLIQRVHGYADVRSQSTRDRIDPQIGCIILRNPVFLDQADWKTPAELGVSFPRQVVKFKTFPELVALPIDPQAASTFLDEFQLVPYDEKQFREGKLPDRQGQQLFRASVLRAYGNRCAVTGETCQLVLEAAHIQPYVTKASNDVRNGIALRADVHALFDAGLISIDGQGCLIVSDQASVYYQSMRGIKVNLPINSADHPSRVALEHHRTQVYRPKSSS